MILIKIIGYVLAFVLFICSIYILKKDIKKYKKK